MKEKNKKLLNQIIKFIISGGIATIIDWGLYYLLYNYLKINPLVANVISFTISLLYNYFASIKWVFKIKNSNKKKFIYFIIFSLIGLLISEIILFVMINKLSINKMFSKIISSLIIVVYNFITRKKVLEDKM